LSLKPGHQLRIMDKCNHKLLLVCTLFQECLRQQIYLLQFLFHELGLLQLLELLKELNQQQELTIVTVLHELNLAARYSSRIALLKQGHIWEVGTPEQVLTPNAIAQVFGVESVIIQTPVGLQVCAISAV